MFATDHAPDFARPEAAGVDDMRRADLALVGDHPPGAIRQLDQFFDFGEALDAGAEFACGLGVGARGTGGVEVSIDDGLKRADEAGRIEQRHQLVCPLGGDDLGLDAEVAPLGDHALQPVEPCLRGRKQHAAGQVQARGLAREFLDLLVQIDGVLLQLGDVRVAIDGVHTARGMPGGS